ncbi:Clathrin light chain [Coemansia sp. RSA 2603]|nr:Clathrin light chain [Coemansia sp. RSA 2603]
MSDQAYDPLAEFLADERAALGDDAAQFQHDASPATNNASPLASFPSAAPTADEAMDVDASMLDPTPPALSPAPQALSPSSTTQFATLTVASPHPSSASPAPPASEFQQEWQTQHQQTIAHRDQQAREKHDACVADAKAAVDGFYAEYNARRERAIEDNRAAQDVDVQMAARGTLWERVVKQIDLATKAAPEEVRSAVGRSPVQHGQHGQQQQVRDTSRMRELLMDLKRDENAPGVRQAKAQKA